MPNFRLRDIRGVIPAMLTPFAPDESVDPERVRALTRHLCKKPIGGLYLTGSTGEGFMMTPDERKLVVEAVLSEARGRVPVIVHVGAISTRMSEELARHAAGAGADAVSAVPPIYWKFSDDNVARYYADIAQAAGIPMVIYNIALAGLVSFDMIKRLGAIDGVEGIKYTAFTHYDIARMKDALGEGFTVYSGADEMAVSGLAFGADGLIGSTFNCLAELFVDLYAAAAADNEKRAAELQRVANRIIFAFLDCDLIPALKLALRWEGVDAGVCRRPFSRFTPEREAEIREVFAALQRKLNTDVPFMRML
ncbi:MAG: dihydrodipicolinate synthase family protein [Clostridiales bacterium]|nr:dihydrodipicolinate synthase family protein [Clostridiales bacterium]